MNQLNINSTNHYPTTATIGFFDGVHLGHKYLIENLISEAKNNKQQSMVITFNNHPRLLFDPNCGLKQLTLPNERIELLSQTKLDCLLLLDFDKQIASLTSKQFLKLLAQQYGVKNLLVGYDHHFGSDRNASIEDYIEYGKEYGVKVKLQNFFSENNVTISSSKVRNAIQKGNIVTANEYLGYNYYINGKVVEGDKIGRTIEFPTANIEIDELKLTPKNGVYAAFANVYGKKYAAMVNIGVRPTVVNKDKTTIECHILGFNSNIYGQNITIEFIKYLRDEIKFDTLQLLKNQLFKDKIAIEEIIKI